VETLEGQTQFQYYSKSGQLSVQAILVWESRAALKGKDGITCTIFLETTHKTWELLTGTTY
jgi:hypothetical protein